MRKRTVQVRRRTLGTSTGVESGSIVERRRPSKVPLPPTSFEKEVASKVPVTPTGFGRKSAFESRIVNENETTREDRFRRVVS